MRLFLIANVHEIMSAAGRSWRKADGRQFASWPKLHTPVSPADEQLRDQSGTRAWCCQFDLL